MSQSQNQILTRGSCTFCHCSGHNIRQCEDQRIQIIERSITELVENNEDFLSFDGQPSRGVLESFFDNIQDLGTIKMYCIHLNLPINHSILFMRRDIVDMILFQREMNSNFRNRNVTSRQQDVLRGQKRDVILFIHNEIKELRENLALHIYVETDDDFRNNVQNTLNQLHEKIQDVRHRIAEYCDLFGRSAYQSLLRMMSMSGDITYYSNIGTNSQRLNGQTSYKPLFDIKKVDLKENEELYEIECPVCYENIDAEKVHVTQCDHKFCYDCISHALKNNNTCPLCREEVSSLTVKVVA